MVCSKGSSASFWAKNICEELGYREKLLSSPAFEQDTEEARKLCEEMSKIKKFDLLLAKKSKKERLIKSLRTPTPTTSKSSRSQSVAGKEDEKSAPEVKNVRKPSKKKDTRFINRNKRLAAHAGETVPMTDDEHFRLQVLVGNMGEESDEDEAESEAKVKWAVVPSFQDEDTITRLTEIDM